MYVSFGMQLLSVSLRPRKIAPLVTVLNLPVSLRMLIKLNGTSKELKFEPLKNIERKEYTFVLIVIQLLQP